MIESISMSLIAVLIVALLTVLKMAATVSTMFDFAGTDANPGTEQDVTGYGPPMIRFKQADDATIDNVAPIPITGSTNYSYWKHIYFEATAGSFTQIDNVKIYTDGSHTWGAQVVLYIGDENPAKTSISDAGYEVADSVLTMVSNHTGISAQTDLFSYNSGSPRSCTIGEAGGIIDAVGDSTNYTVQQMSVATGATAGDLADEDVTWRYDEI